MHFKYLFYLSRRYIKAHRKQFIPFTVIIFLSTLLFTSVYVIKDTFNNYSLRLAEKQYGKWDIKYPAQISELLTNEEITFLNGQTIPKVYEEYLPYHYKTLDLVFRSVSTFDDTLPITLTLPSVNFLKIARKLS